jgi:GNAT superfamily N-acetyltransferase
MRLRRIFNRGKVINAELYDRLKKLDYKVFYNCGDEFKQNRDWWVIVDKGKIVAYCGCLYSERVCIFVRAWVYQDYRGNGLQSKMIRARLKAAAGCKMAITYTTSDNVHSANNLIRNKFLLYDPIYAYAGRDKLYFRTILS